MSQVRSGPPDDKTTYRIINETINHILTRQLDGLPLKVLIASVKDILKRDMRKRRMTRFPVSSDVIIAALEFRTGISSETWKARVPDLSNFVEAVWAGESPPIPQVAELEFGFHDDTENIHLGTARRPSVYEEIVLFATDREYDRSGANPELLNSGVPAANMTYGRSVVTLPLAHRTGQIEEAKRDSQANPSKHVIVRDVSLFATDQAFYDDLDARLRAARRNDVMIFVHGAATTLQGALKRAAQIRFDTKFPGVAMAYSWPSIGNIDGYGADYDRVPAAAKRLRELVENVLGRVNDKASVHIVAHSLGCFISATAFEHFPASLRNRVGEVILAAPDISHLDYPALAEAIRIRARRATVYAVPADRALFWSAKFRKKISRVGSSVLLAAHQGVDAIDASGVVRRSWFGDRHSYIFDANLVGELRSVLDGDGQLRARLEEREHNGLAYYVIRP
ncbi:MAG TPA: alpha/beta fold hydrolase [Xanthomonadales bacterium]|nr:alpha/beta fold hydrolase [Xanthomonadales bacterium]